MKKIQYTCDYCNKIIHPELGEGFITIGSESESDFKFESTIPGSKRLTMRNFHDLHFCSELHFIECFTTKPSNNQ